MAISVIMLKKTYKHCVQIVTDLKHMRIKTGAAIMLKRCPRCGETKDASNYYYAAYTINNLYAYCKPCCKDRDREKSARRHKSPPTIVRESKVCGLCNQEKPVSQFGYNRNRADRLHSYCKPCWVIYVQKAQKKKAI
jgi:hypothetical protein